eukprot:SAG11_NODE_4144_length_2041_cov_1099.343975_1_plen_136_part_10
MAEGRLEAMKQQAALEEDAARQFKAQPLPKSLDRPHVPLKVEPAPLTEPQQFHLSSESRSQARENFEKVQRQKLEAAEVAKAKLQKEAEEAEAMKIRELRSKVLVHKAKPAVFRRPLQIMPSNVPLTTPESPRFGF